MFGKLKMTIFKKILDYVEPNREHNFEKINGTFDRHFDFTMEDGSDYRLQRPKTVKSK